MNFRRGSFREEPEINLVPFIDVLIVIVIFLAVTTTYSRYSEMQINLPTAEATKVPDRPNQINVGISANGQYMVNRTAIVFNTPEAFAAELKRAAGTNADPVVIINADANATHQSVINVMEASRIAGFGKITFTSQQQRR